MSQSPYESTPDVADQRPRQRFPWKWVLLGGILTAVLSYLAIVALILSHESPTGIDLSTASVAVMIRSLALMAIGAVVAIVGGVGWLWGWLRR